MTDAATSKEEQALKAHALAEKCFLAGNVYSARQWMQSAVRLAPGLPGTAQAVAAYDVHHAAARRPPDWYAVLGLQQPRGGALAHDDIKRQHRRLCLLVHPDKNHCAAADGAFKLVQAAYAALSAVHPPPPPRDEERLRFWQAAAQDDIAPPPQARAGPRQPPIGRPTTRPVAPPPPGPPELGIRLPCCQCHPPCVFSTLHRAGGL